MMKLLTLCDKKEWNKYVTNSAEFDFYHTWFYHNLATDGQPLLFIYERGEDFIGLPLLKREITDSPYFDITSVYGYTGPIANKKIDELERNMIEDFKDAFSGFLEEGNYVTVFIRMHPYFKQRLLFEDFGGIYDNGFTVSIDLTQSLDTQRKGYQHTTLVSVKHAQQRGYRVVENKDPESICLLADIYAETMQRVNASKCYLFDVKYFENIVNTDEYDARIFIVYDGDIAICGSICVFTNDLVQAHLIGTRTEYLKYSPAKLLIDEVSQVARKLGMKHFHLGGGVGFKEDNLFKWKQCFSNTLMEYKSWRYVANKQVYQDMLDTEGIDSECKIDFFPLYRCLAAKPQFT